MHIKSGETLYEGLNEDGNIHINLSLSQRESNELTEVDVPQNPIYLSVEKTDNNQSLWNIPLTPQADRTFRFEHLDLSQDEYD